jgi:hypothetical protein
MPDFLDNLDFMSRSTTLRLHGVARTFFDPANPDHCASLKHFMEQGTWGNVQFYPEFPYTEVPMTVLAKFVAYHLKVETKSSAVRAAEAAANRSNLAETAAANLERGKLLQPAHENT